MSSIVYSISRLLNADEFIDLLGRSNLAERRPITDRERIDAMIKHGNLTCTAWDGKLLIGVARSLTDFAFCCYLSDLAVDVAYQRRGIGTELIRLTQTQIHRDASVILLAAPKAQNYYPHIGMTRHDSAWIAPGFPPIRGSTASVRLKSDATSQNV